MNRRGMQLLEVLVGVAILGTVGLAVLGAYAQSAREVQTTSDYTIAFLLSQKVAEESIQSTIENAHASDQLTELGNQPPAPIRDGSSPYFDVLEDTSEPWGELTPRKDLSIDIRDEGLWRLYREYNLSVIAVDQPVLELPGAPSYLQKVTISLEWPGLKDTRNFDFPLAVPKAIVTPRGRPEVAADPAALDEAIRKLLYPSIAGPDLTAVVNTVGAQMTVVRDYGSICVVINDAIDKMQALDDRIATARAGLATPPPDRELAAAQKVGVAKLYERRAAIAWQALLYCREPAWRLATNLTGAALGNPRPDRALDYGLLTMATRFPGDMERGTSAALALYADARRPLPAFGTAPYWQYLLERKVLELSMLTVIMFEPGDVTFTRAWIDAMRKIYTHRNKFVQAYLEREKALAASVDSVRAAYPELRDRVNEVADTVKALDALRGRVRAQL